MDDFRAKVAHTHWCGGCDQTRECLNLECTDPPLKLCGVGACSTVCGSVPAWLQLEYLIEAGHDLYHAQQCAEYAGAGSLAAAMAELRQQSLALQRLREPDIAAMLRQPS